MSMNPVPRKIEDETEKAIKEFLKKGGEITYCAKGERSTDIGYKNYYGKKKKEAKK